MQEVILVEDYAGDNPTGIPIQLIFVNWKTERSHERFDIGICRISYDGRDVSISRDFEQDSSDQVINIRRCENKWMLGATINRYLRLKKKYPDW